MELRTDLVNQTSPSQAKIALFRSLFRGREDVYPRRFESRKTGKAGDAPACANEWVRGICEKPRIKCAECPHRRFLPVTDDVIRWHLSGYDADRQPFVAGVYPLLQNETCFLLAVDFDKAGWREDAIAFLEAARRLNLPAALERSRSGRGGAYRIQVASSETLVVHSSSAVLNLRASRPISSRGSRSDSRRSGLSQTRGTRTVRKPEIATAFRDTTPSGLQCACTSTSPCPPRTATMRPFFSSMSVRAASACSTTAAVQAPNTCGSGMAVVEP